MNNFFIISPPSSVIMRTSLRLIALSASFLLLSFTATHLATSQTQVIDFEGLEPGSHLQTVAGTSGYSGISVHGSNPACPALNAAIIFDSTCPGGCSGDDDDLGTPNQSFGGPGIGVGGESGSAYENSVGLGNMLIVHQVCSELTQNPVSNPRDHGGTSTIRFTFPTTVVIENFTVVDVEANESLVVDYYDRQGGLLGSQSVSATGNNGVAVIEASVDGTAGVDHVAELAIARRGSGAIDNITFTPYVADLRLTKDVDNAAPEHGDDVTFTIWVANDGPDDATGVRVTDPLPDSLALVSHDGGTVVASGQNLTWEIGLLSAGDSTRITVTTTVENMLSVENIAQVATSDVYDPDSTPGNNDPSEDDQDSAVVTPGESSGGGDAGIESDGNMATRLARRLFNRRVDAQMQTALMAAPQPHVFSNASPEVFLAQSGTLTGPFRTAIPETGPHSTLAYEVSPTDLLNLTNASSVLAIDYLQVSGRRLGALFTAVSPSGELYDHAKASCDRLAGGRLEDVRLVRIHDRSFVLSKLRQPGGEIDYAISFVAYRSGSSYKIDSRFSPAEYDVPAAEEIINVQVWGISPEFSAAVIGDLLTTLHAKNEVTYLNESTDIPQIYVVDGSYNQGQVTLRLANHVGAAQVRIHGSVARTEAEAIGNIRTSFDRVVTIPASQSGRTLSEVDLDMGSMFDAILYVEHEASKSFDQLYHADGAWSFAAGEASSIDHFETRPNDQLFLDDRYLVERSGQLQGQVSDWTSLFRYLRPGGQPVDLTAFSNISFMASGQGTVRFIIEKAGIKDWDQYGYTIELSPEPKRYRIQFSELRKETTFDGPFEANDVTLLAFYAIGNGVSSKDFSISIENLAFGGAINSMDGTVPTTFDLAQNFPNPFNPSTEITFSLTESMPIRLTVFDMLGRALNVLADGQYSAGQHTVQFDATHLPSGQYIYRIETPDGASTRIMSLLK